MSSAPDAPRGRWAGLFDDLEAQLEESERLEQAAEVADRTRRELASVPLADRLRAAVGSRVVLRLQGVGPAGGVLEDAGPGWLLLLDEGREVLVATAAVVSVTGLPSRAASPLPPGALAGRIGLGSCLRGLVRDRAPVRVELTDGSTQTGTFDRVGADWVELAVHDAGSPRRAGEVRAVVVLPFAALARVRPER
ncbi:hypothetical protein CLV35_2826 [Motilibacter peucedani]|uniref:Uncharacterized protein n=1 Tax=Motilibacter peucedani TaxID=598650 RepID=A0A420XMT0_9ACTN|nr:hypothetical protein [Motilibacter peucedani]RKS72579.1 hypothetical protein CLV35_2826 [Motilibacter peucedani]